MHAKFTLVDKNNTVFKKVEYKKQIQIYLSSCFHSTYAKPTCLHGQILTTKNLLTNCL